MGKTVCTYQSTGSHWISDSDNGPEAAYWTVEILLFTNDIIDKWKFKKGMTGRGNEVNLLLSNHLRERRGKKFSLNLVNDNYLKAIDHSMLWVLWKLPSHKGHSRLHMQPEQNIWREIVWQHQACFKLKHITQISLGLRHALLHLLQTLVIQELLWKFSSQWIVIHMASLTLNTQRLM